MNSSVEQGTMNKEHQEHTKEVLEQTMSKMNKQRIIKRNNNVKQEATRGATMSSKEYQEEQRRWTNNSKRNNKKSKNVEQGVVSSSVEQGITRKVVTLNKE